MVHRVDRPELTIQIRKSLELSNKKFVMENHRTLLRYTVQEAFRYERNTSLQNQKMKLLARDLKSEKMFTN